MGAWGGWVQFFLGPRTSHCTFSLDLVCSVEGVQGLLVVGSQTKKKLLKRPHFMDGRQTSAGHWAIIQMFLSCAILGAKYPRSFCCKQIPFLIRRERPQLGYWWPNPLELVPGPFPLFYCIHHFERKNTIPALLKAQVCFYSLISFIIHERKGSSDTFLPGT